MTMSLKIARGYLWVYQMLILIGRGQRQMYGIFADFILMQVGATRFIKMELRCNRIALLSSIGYARRSQHLQVMFIPLVSDP